MSALAIRDIETLDSTASAAAALTPLRLSILKELRRPDSASGVARALGLPRQNVNHHLRALEGAGLVRLVQERRKGNCVERVVQASASHYLISPEALGELGADKPERVTDRFSWAHLVSTLGRSLKDLATLRRRADAAGKKLPTFTLDARVRFAGPQALNAFTEELANEFARLVAKHQMSEAAKDARSFTFFVGAHPTVTKTEDEAAGEAREHEQTENSHENK